jgi:hypothetical protein
MSAHPRRPLVLTASPRALEQAQRLGVPGVLENLVEEAITAGRRLRWEGKTLHVVVADGVAVKVKRVRAPSSGRLAWKPLAVQASNHRRRERTCRS